ncbi:DNA repair protein RAD5B [Nicotiana sylvestris]|uniref:SWI/SNF-related matrix-associated actin-dependent regulator of chromatin subfamily A member 3-like 3 n=1 Tax=Nicotiana sylvestris TaxID=4096 RepID=A0A1U7VYX1_NICSY|nr:PREDICTED: putative SWI/SNF-related matrix-associated actin-dependent regulator of chromatin subfamily A member 3-like 3 [Nicotiana sylvestris]
MEAKVDEGVLPLDLVESDNEKKVKMIKSIIGSEITEKAILEALSQQNNNPDAAINHLLDSSPLSAVHKTVTSTGVRISATVKQENVEESVGFGKVHGLNVKEEPDVGIDEKGLKVEEKKVIDGYESKGSVGKCDTSFNGEEMVNGLKVKEEPDMVISEKGLKVEEKKVIDGYESKGSVGKWDLSFDEWLKLPENNPGIDTQKPKEEEKKLEIMKVKEEQQDVLCVEPLSARPLSKQEYNSLKGSNVANGANQEYSRLKSSSNVAISANMEKMGIKKNMLSTIVIEDGDFPEDPDWLLVGRTIVTGLSTTKGRKLENNEIVHFAFPQQGNSKCSSQWGGSRAAVAAASSIVRFSTKRFGEIGRLPMEWAKCLIPLVNSSKVKVHGRCVAAPVTLQLMQELMLYVSFYIHQSVFTSGDKSTWKLDSPSQIDTTTYPLLTLFKLLKVKPFQNAEFTPDELYSRKRQLSLDCDSNEAASASPIAKRRNGCQQYSEQNKDEHDISEASFNKLVGSVDMYDLKEMDAPDTLMCCLRHYQKEALYWMSESEKGSDVEETSKTLHPCWAAYRICEERKIYVNIFSGEATTEFPTASKSARGGILADAMGLGKTVMTIALILAKMGRGGSTDDQECVLEDVDEDERITKRITYADTEVSRKAKGSTLIVCPMALLGQWKDELEAHSKPGSVSVFVHYGGDRSNDPKVIAEQDVVLTTYGVLSATYKADRENSIFHKVDWYRVVLDEAHTIKSWKTLGAQAAFTLSAHCRWCLTGTPLQNNLEDLYSLLCFLHVEPWCNWAWWNKLIQRPYENGDQRALKLIKAILRPLMLRRTKDTKDKEGRPILVLPPTDIQVIQCIQSEAERDFYDALFKRSKVQFDQFVAQGKVLHNYANILELLLRLRQCCNHPFLVMSRSDTQEFADLDKLARRFLETNPDSTTQKALTPAYVEEVVEGIRNGENTECPICLESADDPVLTPCAHRMCRECLLSSWRTPASGLCPICRQMIRKNELFTCPSENRFRIDVEKNWQESSKVSKLLDCLESIRKSGSGEKSIVFSQWTTFLDLLEIPLKRKKIGYLRFDGKLVQKQRERVLKEFSETNEKTILLMSLKAGGVGLNLTAASNVFLMDPWWNPAVEEQAIMRIHRIGQKNTVRVRRFIVKDTVEERMQQVQARKQRMIAGALTDEEVRSARLEELKMLFR